MKSQEFGSELITFMRFIGHQQNCFNEGGYLVCDNVPLVFYQCNMAAE